MENLGINKINIEAEKHCFFYHPLYTTLAFLLSLPYYFAFGIIFYLCWITNKTIPFFGFLTAFILLSHPILLIAKAFIRLLSHKPAIVLTEKYLFDNWNNIRLDWTDIKQIGSFNLRLNFMFIKTTKDEIVFKQIFNPSKLFFMALESLFSGMKLKINLTLLRDKNSYIISRTKYFWRTKTATNISFLQAGRENIS